MIQKMLDEKPAIYDVVLHRP